MEKSEPSKGQIDELFKTSFLPELLRKGIKHINESNYNEHGVLEYNHSLETYLYQAFLEETTEEIQQLYKKEFLTVTSPSITIGEILSNSDPKAIFMQLAYYVDEFKKVIPQIEIANLDNELILSNIQLNLLEDPENEELKKGIKIAKIIIGKNNLEKKKCEKNLLSFSSALDDMTKKDETNVNSSYNLKWNTKKSSKNDFLELIKSLVESEAIIGTQKDIISAFSELVQLPINNPDSQLQSMKKSRTDSKKTKFLDSLKESLNSWLSE